MTEDAAAASAAGDRTLLATLTLVYAVSQIDRQAITLLVDPIRAELSINDTQAGALTGLAFALLYSVCGIPFGWLADRVDRVRLIAAGLAPSGRR